MVSGNGILILNTLSQVSDKWSYLGTTLMAIAALLVIIGCLLPDNRRALALVLCFVAVALFGVNVVIRFSPKCYENKYQVIFDDTVSANEVYENYDVVKIDGKIWTIREK